MKRPSSSWKSCSIEIVSSAFTFLHLHQKNMYILHQKEKNIMSINIFIFNQKKTYQERIHVHEKKENIMYFLKIKMNIMQITLINRMRNGCSILCIR